MSNKKTVEHEVESLSDADLRSALTETEQWREKGILEKGWIREVSSDRLAQVYPLPVDSLQSMGFPLVSVGIDDVATDDVEDIVVALQLRAWHARFV